MDNQLPDCFDVIVIGTGVTESMVAAAASRIGKSVLQVDGNCFYGNAWASFNLENLQKIGISFDEKTNTDNVLVEGLIGKSEKLVPTSNNRFGLENVKQQWHLNKDDGEQKWSFEEITNHSNRFNIDIAPKVNYSRGPFIDLLIQSNMSRYFDFRCFNKLHLWLNNCLEIAPCTRSEVFSNDRLSLIEKRHLMKLIEGCAAENEDSLKEKYKNEKFVDFLSDQKLSTSLMDFILYAIVMETKEVSFLNGLRSTKRFLSSTGQYGKTPFLYPKYGSGEISQVFCRVCAVYGGVYCLNRAVPAFILDRSDTQKCNGIICGNQKIKADIIVASIDKVPEEISGPVTDVIKISRAIFIIDRSLCSQDTNDHLNLILFPDPDNNNLIKVIELGHSMGVCPKGLFVVHLFCKQITDPQLDFENCVKQMFSENGPKILWSMFYTAFDVKLSNVQSSCSNVFVCSGPDLDFDLDFAIDQGKPYLRLNSHSWTKSFFNTIKDE